MSEDMPDSLIPYDEIVQEALRAVVGRVLGQVESSGGVLPGDHHFYITFLTGAPGVRISQHLKTKYTEQMTIVIQHWYENLSVNDEGFSITLNFGNNPEPMVIPFDALRTFVDPSVEFGLRFEEHIGIVKACRF